MEESTTSGKKDNKSSPELCAGESVAFFLIEEWAVVPSVPCSSESFSWEIMALDDVGAVILLNDVKYVTVVFQRT